MRQVRDYKKLFNLSDDEYKDILEYIYFFEDDILKKAYTSKGLSCYRFENPDRCFCFKDGKRISEEEWNTIRNSKIL